MTKRGGKIRLFYIVNQSKLKGNKEVINCESRLRKDLIVLISNQ